MTSIKFTPLYGIHADQPLSFVLEVDEVRMLLDCGWDDAFDEHVLAPLRDVASTVDVVLVSHPDLAHLGALPYARKHFGLTAPVYGTLPTRNMGRLEVKEAIRTAIAERALDVLSEEEVDAAFDAFKELKFSQRLQLRGKGQGISVMPLPAGHLLGGSMWRIATEADEIVYAVHFNHSKDRHLKGSALEMLSRPAVLITDARNALRVHPSRRERDAALIDRVVDTLRDGGDVLLPCDSAGRVLELLLALDQHWMANRNMAQYPLVFLSAYGPTLRHLAMSQIEWMSEQVAQQFSTQRANAFELKNVRVRTSMRQVEAIPGPKVVIATPLSMRCGFSHQLFNRIAADPRHCVLLTSRGPPDSLSAQLLDMLERRARSLRYLLTERVPLAGEELAAHMAAQAELRREEEEEARRVQEAEERRRRRVGDEGESDTEESEDEAAPAIGRFGRIRHPMFAFREDKALADDYGEALDMSWFAEELEQQQQQQQQQQQWLQASAAAPGRAASADTLDGPMSMAVDDEEGGTVPEDAVPTKSVTRECEVVVRCRVDYVNVEGLSDGPSVRRLLTRVGPHRVVLVQGSEQERAALAHALITEGCPQVVTPGPGEAVDLSTSTAVFKVLLDDMLMAHTDAFQVGDYSLAFVDAQLQQREGTDLPVLATAGPDSAPQPSSPRAQAVAARTVLAGLASLVGDLDDSDGEDEGVAGDAGGRGTEPGAVGAVQSNVLGGVQPARDAAVPAVLDAAPPRPLLLVRTAALKLPELKQLLASHGFSSDMYAGALYFRSGVVLRKEGDADVTLEGPLCDAMVAIRDLVYGQFATV